MSHQSLGPTRLAGWAAILKSTEFLVTAIVASGLREHIRKLRRVLTGSRYRIETHRGIGYSLTVAQR